MTEQTRRFFLRAHEIGPLFRGIVSGDPIALRRAIGARRSGRIAVLLGLLGLWLGTAGHGWYWVVLAQLAVTPVGARRCDPPLSRIEYQRLSLWLAGPAAAFAFPWRGTEIGSIVCVALVLAAHLWLWRSLSRGLGEVVAD